MPTSLEVSLTAIWATPARVSTVPQVVSRLSRDFYWYSPVLRKQLDGKVADVVVHPLNVARKFRMCCAYCYAHDVPGNARGARARATTDRLCPLQGGVLLDLSRMDQIESIGADGVAVCQPGVRLGVLETEARKTGLGASLLSLNRGQSIGRRFSRRRLGWHWFRDPWRPA